MELKKVFGLLRKLNLQKTVYFNLKYFPWKTAVHLPAFVYRRTDLYKMRGQIVLNAPPRSGMIKIGPHGLGTQDVK